MGSCSEQISYLKECLQRNRTIEYSTIEVVSNKLSSISLEDLNYLQFAHSNCQEKLKPFFCLYLFHLVVPGEEISPSPMACKRIRDEFCESEWKSAENFKALPKCELLEASTDLLELCPSCSGIGLPFNITTNTMASS